MATSFPIVRLAKVLQSPPAGELPATIRTYRAGDATSWLRLHQRCFLMPWAPPWDEDDFSREFLRRPWWDASRMAFALTDSHRHAVGTVTVAGPVGREMQVSWLAVDPRYRRRQVGHRLMAWAEHTCWMAGGRVLAAETLASWHEAVAFYRAMGFR